MKILITLLFIYILQIQATNWDFRNITYQMENDADVQTDEGYSHGAGFSLLFLRPDINESILHIPFTNYKNQQNYISFAYAQQLYTPDHLGKKELLTDDRPYAGYSYIQTALHQSYNNTLKSLVFQLGTIGPASKMENVQKGIHDSLDIRIPQGWNNQLSNEIAIGINYNHKKYIKNNNFLNLESVHIPEYGFNLGNISTKMFIGSQFRFGWNIPRDYGLFTMGNSAYNRLALDSKTNNNDDFSFSFNVSTKLNLIGRNIFLDGNTFKESYSVEKNYLVLDGGYGISIGYKKFSISYLRKHSTKEYKIQNRFLSYGSLIISYNY